MIHFSSSSTRTLTVLRSAMQIPDPEEYSGPGLLERELGAAMGVDVTNDNYPMTPAEERTFASFFSWVGEWSSCGHLDYRAPSSWVYLNMNTGFLLVVHVVETSDMDSLDPSVGSHVFLNSWF